MQKIDLVKFLPITLGIVRPFSCQTLRSHLHCQPSLMAAGTWPIALFLAFSFILLGVAFSDEESEAAILVQFEKTITDPSGSLQSWNSNSGPCVKPNTWKGVICDDKTGQVFGLQLENMGLSGELNLDPLTQLQLIRTLSFMNNSFTGPMPNVKQFKGLKSVYFSMNNMSGNISDDAFDGMQSLKKVYLSRNGFTGKIPSSLVQVSSLLELWADNNGFVGEIPNFQQSGLTAVNVSNNNLEGKIPDRLSKMDPSLFAGNKALCGPPLHAQCLQLKSPSPAPPPTSLSPPPPPPPPSSKRKKVSPTLIAAIAVVSIGVAVAIIGVAFAVLKHKKQKNNKGMVARASSFERPLSSETYKMAQGEQGVVTHHKATSAADEKDQGNLVFVREERRETFELQDLLRASAEVLGSGEFGSSYKATLLNGLAVVVKRFREMNGLGREDFQDHMRRLGRLSHPNLLPLVAYYYRKEEKLLVNDFVPCGSLASLLHGKRTAENPALDWPTRLKIVRGIARGLNYLYDELSMLCAPHGHLKSSNVLLDDNYEPLLSDYGLQPAMTQSHASQVMIAYKSPEYKQHGRLCKKSDVWSFGVLILEILTGKYPGNYSRQMGGGSDLANWVNSVVREEWTGEVFDREMKRSRNGEGEMLNLLQIGLGCCEADVNKRWELRDALEKIEELRERDGEEDYSSFASEGEGYSSRGGVTEDEFSFSTNNP